MNPMTLPRYDAAYLAWNTVATFDNEHDARTTVDRLARRGFPIEHLDIVGSDLKYADRVTGPLNRGRLARAGAISGLWSGLLFGLLFSLFAPAAAAIALIVTTAAIGAASGAALALASRKAAQRSGLVGQFATVRTFVAGRYDIVARNGFAEQARTALADQTQTPLITA